MPASNILHATTGPGLLTRLREMPGGPAAPAPHRVKWFNPNGSKAEFLMTAKKDNADIDVVAAGRAIYAGLQSRLEATDKGSFVVIDAVSGDYEVDPVPHRWDKLPRLTWSANPGHYRPTATSGELDGRSVVQSSGKHQALQASRHQMISGRVSAALRPAGHHRNRHGTRLLNQFVEVVVETGFVRRIGPSGLELIQSLSLDYIDSSGLQWQTARCRDGPVTAYDGVVSWHGERSDGLFLTWKANHCWVWPLLLSKRFTVSCRPNRASGNRWTEEP